jgi:ABC-2 type transport system ATP-binding protein
MRYAAHDVTVEIAGTPVVRGVTLVAEPGTVFAVVGGDGAGKSTLLRCFTGERVPVRGSIERPDPENVGYMPSTSGTWRDLTVDENLEFVARVFGVPAAVFAERRARLLERAGLVGAHDRLAGELSGGMRQKLGLCLAAVHAPPLLVLDEPTTGVDPVSRVELWRMIAQAVADGAAVIMATTYLDEAERATRLLVLDDGVPLLVGTPTSVLAGSGAVVALDRPTDAARAWRRGRTFHEWRPDGPDDVGTVVRPDLEDTVIAAMLAAREGGRP